MSLRRELDKHRQSLGEIREIMNSMKTLAYMETRKLAHFIDTQTAVVNSIERAATDLLKSHPDILPDIKQQETAYLLLGSERGFCGDFNHALLRQLDSMQQLHGNTNPRVVTIGRKLHSLTEDDPRVVVTLDGASTVEEITNLLIQLVSELGKLQQRSQGLRVYCLYHDGSEGVTAKLLLPPFQTADEEHSNPSQPPVLNMPPQTLFAELSEHYLFAVLHQMLFTSLHAENHNRVTHMDSAVQHLDEETQRLKQRYNTLRQEEITEEIEVILLNAANLAGSRPQARRSRRANKRN